MIGRREWTVAKQRLVAKDDVRVDWNVFVVVFVDVVIIVIVVIDVVVYVR